MKGLVIVGNKSLLRCDRTWSKILDEYDHYECVKTPEEFPPPNTSLTRQEVMARAKAQCYRQYCEIYEPGKATSYDGPFD
ncbi:hypothetical protein DPMN_074061 [Dreissena polymorpha]|uniref:Uncharacterized protein n=1 Tax=Dreissena polymorpha TaxID=45954 RepID=A0A9D4BMZ0_DREPO|nr:hypothetical protein DPMN_074061 [Dreissena polymorpha]